MLPDKAAFCLALTTTSFVCAIKRVKTSHRMGYEPLKIWYKDVF